MKEREWKATNHYVLNLADRHFEKDQWTPHQINPEKIGALRFGLWTLDSIHTELDTEGLHFVHHGKLKGKTAQFMINIVTGASIEREP